MLAGPSAISPFALVGLDYGPTSPVSAATAAGLGIGDPMIASGLAQISTSHDVLAAFASPQSGDPTSAPSDVPLFAGPLAQATQLQYEGQAAYNAQQQFMAPQGYGGQSFGGPALADALLYDSYA